MIDGSAPAAILSIGTAVPRYKGLQREVGEWMANSFVNNPASARLIRMLCANSGVETRYSCVDDYFLPPQESRFAPGAPTERSPSTAERMAIFERQAPPLGAEAARQAMLNYATKTGITPTDIANKVTHLIVATCTGFFAPGLDFTLAQSLQLPRTVERTVIGFMGCSAMFNCLRVANQIVQADSDALVLVVSVELCTLHSQPEPLIEQLIGASFFADGASACLVGRPDELAGDYFRLAQFLTSMKPDTETEMVWQIGNYGFALRLSPRIPEHLAKAAPDTLSTLFTNGTPDFWAIHPGGSAILDRRVKRFGRDEAQVAASRTVLRNYGNMSSATILFVLAELQCSLQREIQSDLAALASPTEPLENEQSQNRTGVAMAFGPGLVIEMARIEYMPPLASQLQITGAGSANTRKPATLTLP